MPIVNACINDRGETCVRVQWPTLLSSSDLFHPGNPASCLLALIKFFKNRGMSTKELFTNTMSTSYLTPLNTSVLFGADRCTNVMLKHGALEAQMEAKVDKSSTDDGALRLCCASGRSSLDSIKILVKAYKERTGSSHINAANSFWNFHLSTKTMRFFCLAKKALFGAEHLSDEMRRLSEACGGKTALHYAAESGSLTIVRYLVERGADTGAVDDMGRNARGFAKANGFEAIVEWLDHFEEKRGERK